VKHKRKAFVFFGLNWNWMLQVK